MPESVQQPTPQPQVASTPQSTNWKKIVLTVLIIIVVTGLIAGVYWFFILNKETDTSDLTGPVPKSNVTTATPSATSSTQKDETADWKTYIVNEVGVTFKYPKDWNDATYKQGLVTGEYFSGNEYFHAAHPQAGNNYTYATISLIVSRVKAGNQEESLDMKYYNLVNNLKSGETSTKQVTYTRKPNITVANISSPYYLTDISNATPRYGLRVAIKKENTFYYLNLESNTSKGLEDNQKIFEQFLSTFKFLD